MSIDLQNLNEQVRELTPPSARDRLIFEAVVVQGRGQCEVAAEQGVSQPRVSQIVAEVGSWLNRSLPRGQNGGTDGGLAVGEYVAMAQIDFLLQRTLQEMEHSKHDKVTEKAGKRGEVQWTETKTEKRQLIPVGLFNVASRLALAKAKLAGVDVSGRMQRELILAEERERRERRGNRGQGTGARGQEPDKRQETAKAKQPLIKKSGKAAIAAEVVQPQVLAEQEDKLREERDAFVKERACKQLINHLRQDPECAGWSEEQLQEHVRFLWELENSEPRGKSSVEAREHASQQGANSLKFSQFPRGKASRANVMRRRKFFAPLAAG